MIGRNGMSQEAPWKPLWNYARSWSSQGATSFFFSLCVVKISKEHEDRNHTMVQMQISVGREHAGCLSKDTHKHKTWAVVA
jgi:hypothetical protein